MFFPLCQAAERRLSWCSWCQTAPCCAALSMHLVGFWEQSINISEGCSNKCLFDQKLLILSLVLAMVKHIYLNRKMNTDWRDSLLMSVYILALETHLTSKRAGSEKVVMQLWMWLQPGSHFSGSPSVKYCFSPQIAFIPLWKWGLLSGLKSGVLSVMPLPSPLLLACCWRRTSLAVAAWLGMSMSLPLLKSSTYSFLA